MHFKGQNPLLPGSELIFVSTKFHFDETIILAGLVSLMLFDVRPTFMGTLQWDNFCNFGATLLGFGTLFTNVILLWIRNFEKNPTTRTPKKNQKTPKKDMDFHDGISCQRFELEGWDLVQCLLISFCFGSEILKKIRPPQPPKKTPK